MNVKTTRRRRTIINLNSHFLCNLFERRIHIFGICNCVWQACEHVSMWACGKDEARHWRVICGITLKALISMSSYAEGCSCWTFVGACLLNHFLFNIWLALAFCQLIAFYAKQNSLAYQFEYRKIINLCTLVLERCLTRSFTWFRGFFS